MREIVRDRDSIIRDEFDQAMENSAFLDLDKHLRVDELWEVLAHKIHDRLLPGLSPGIIAGLLREREKESSTAITHFVAIPHIITRGQGQFGVLMIRAREGITFNSHYPAIRALFVLIGTKDMRNLHLRSLAAIAQVVQHAGFEQKWMKAKNHEELTDLFLLGSRQRLKV